MIVFFLLGVKCKLI